MSFARFAPFLLLALPVAASAQSMNAESFHRRAEALQKKGPLAVFSGGEIKALMGEAKAAGQKSGANRAAALKAGQKPRYCPPPPPVRMGNTEFMAGLSAIAPPDRARIDMTEAMTRIMMRKYPCPG
ncbi:MAG: hypothetical protein LH465_05060 [Sphingomonas bacterium]|nr:hypothetical protein [Sphingomonas bacterium]